MLCDWKGGWLLACPFIAKQPIVVIWYRERLGFGRCCENGEIADAAGCEMEYFWGAALLFLFK